MKPIPFAAGHAAHRDWRVALARALADMLHDARVATAHAAGGGELPAQYTLGLCYLTDAFAGDAEAILAELKLRLPGVHWVGTVGVGVAATGAEHFDVPALALMLALGFASVVKARLLARVLGAPVNSLRWALVWATAGAAILGWGATQLPEWAELLIGVPFILGIYAWLIWTRGFGPADRELFRKHPEPAAAPAS